MGMVESAEVDMAELEINKKDVHDSNKAPQQSGKPCANCVDPSCPQ